MSDFLDDLDKPGSDESSEGEPPKEQAEDDKRVRDLQSKADAAEARANKAEAALKAAKEQGERGGDSADPRYAAVMDQLREANLDAVYGEIPELRQFDIDRSLIEGTTRNEMRDSARNLAALIGSVRTKARNEVLAENGLSADAPSATPAKRADFASMDSKEFDELVRRAMRGGGS